MLHIEWDFIFRSLIQLSTVIMGSFVIKNKNSMIMSISIICTMLGVAHLDEEPAGVIPIVMHIY